MTNLHNFPEYSLLNPHQRISFCGHPPVTQEAISKKLKFGARRKILIETSAGARELLLTVVPAGDGVTLEGLHFAPMKGVYTYKEPRKPAITIKRQMVVTNPVIMTILAEFKKIDAEDREKTILKMQKEMRKLLPATAKAAIKDQLHTMLDGTKPVVLHAWFQMKKFKNIPDVREFSKMRDLSGITLNSGPDGFGHTKGSSVQIDWATKTFTLPHPWSTDD